MNDIERSSLSDFDALLRLGVHEALAQGDFQTAFERFFSELPRSAPKFFGCLPPKEERPIVWAMFRQIWNHTPRPDLGWKRLNVSKPERNGACPCGSGRKFKQCCARLEGSSPFPESGFSVLAYVLETIPVSGYPGLPFKQLDPTEIAHVASEWSKDGRTEAATLLLEALLSPGQKLDARHEAAFDTLCDLYLDAYREEDRLRLVSRIMQVSDKVLRAAALHRRATLYSDCGEFVQAWETFKEAQRIDPDNPSLSHLELMLLANENRYDEVQIRAGFWAKRLVKLGYGDESLVALMEDVARDPDVLRQMLYEHARGDAEDRGAWDDEPVDARPEDHAAFLALIDALPTPASHYGLSLEGNSAGPLTPTPGLIAVEQAWESMNRDSALERNPWADRSWLEWLRSHPLAWHSFFVLESLLCIIQDGPSPPEADETVDRMEEALLDHATALLRRVVADHGAEGATLEWGWMENRPALRLLMHRIELAYATDAEIPLLEWLLALNPNDNSGHRERLIHAYCEAGRAVEALAVCDRYPNDTLPGTCYGRVLALFLLDRRGDAVAALANASKRLPKVLKTLVAARPKPPALTEGLVTPGGDDQAWTYRDAYRATWQDCGALDWLKSVARQKA